MAKLCKCAQSYMNIWHLHTPITPKLLINRFNTLVAYMRPFPYSFTRACITFRQINLRGSIFDTVVAEINRYLGVHFASLCKVVCTIVKVGYWEVFVLGSVGIMVPWAFRMPTTNSDSLG